MTYVFFFFKQKTAFDIQIFASVIPDVNRVRCSQPLERRAGEEELHPRPHAGAFRDALCPCCDPLTPPACSATTSTPFAALQSRRSPPVATCRACREVPAAV